MPLRAARVGRVGVIGHPVAKTAVVARAVTPGRAQRNPGDTRQQYSLNIDFRCPERVQAAARGGRPGAAGTTARPAAGATTGSGR